MNIHTRLRALILVTLLPIAIFGIAGAVVLVQKERDTLARGLRDQVRAIMVAVDAELYASVGPLQILAASPNLERDDLELFRAEAQRALEARRDDWANILVSDPEDGRMLMNLLIPPGAQLPAARDPETIRQTARSGQPSISKVVTGPVLQRPLFGIRVPVVRDGGTKYVLTGVVETAVIDRLIARQNFPESLAVAVLDSEYRFVVRRPQPTPSSDYASESLKQALQAGDEGWQRGRLLDGTEIYRAFKRSPISGWATSVAVPRSIVEEGLFGTWLLLAGFVAAAILGLSIAWTLAGRLTRPIAALAAAAPALGRGDASALPPLSQIDEVRELSQSLREAALAIRDREDRQVRAEQSLREADRAKNEFLAMLGHELRNPLASVANVTRLLEFADRQPELLQNVRDILGRQVDHMTHLLDDLLEIGRLAGGKIRLECEPLDLGRVARELFDAWQRGGRFAEHTVTADIEPAWVSGDRVRIEQVLSNLLDNALKYTPPGGRIVVSVRAEPPNALLQVRDSGDGIHPALIERVFDLFVQGERSLAREKGGLGIGLTMAKRLTELHNGTITATSPGKGQGATFTVALPLIEPPHVATQTGRATDLPKRRILVVEDNDDARTSLVTLLTKCGHDVHAEATGESGVTAAIAMSPDLALVDIGLPDIDGYEVARRLRSALVGKPLRLVALTGYGSPDDQRRALESGFDAHLIKPLDAAAFEALLEFGHFGSLARVEPGST